MNLPSINTTGMGTAHGYPPLSWPPGLAIYQTLNDFQTFKIGLDYKFLASLLDRYQGTPGGQNAVGRFLFAGRAYAVRRNPFS